MPNALINNWSSLVPSCLRFDTPIPSQYSSIDMLESAPILDLLILGGGWTYTFLSPLLDDHHTDLTYAATTRNGRSNTLQWTWDPSEDASADQYRLLPRAKTVVIVFPIKGVGGSQRLLQGYEKRWNVEGNVRWIQLGSSGIWDGGPTLHLGEKKPAFQWTDRHSTYARDNDRAVAEDELLSLSSNTFILNLSGLWGGERDPINWIPRVAPTKEALATKTSIHLIHGLDVARAIVAVHLSPLKATASQPALHQSLSATTLVDEKEQTRKRLGQRYLLTDLRVYDWWDFISAWGLSPTSPSSFSSPLSPLSTLLSFTTMYSPGASGSDLLGDQPRWVLELMDERGVRALPRSAEVLGRALDSRDFWRDFGLTPIKGRLERASV